MMSEKKGKTYEQVATQYFFINLCVIFMHAFAKVCLGDMV